MGEAGVLGATRSLECSDCGTTPCVCAPSGNDDSESEGSPKRRMAAAAASRGATVPAPALDEVDETMQDLVEEMQEE